MNALVLASKELTMTSREIADRCSKAHFHVIRDIENMFDGFKEVEGYEQYQDASKFGCTYLDACNRQQKEYVLNKELILCLVTGYSIPLRMAVIQRLEELEQQQKVDKPSLPDFSDPVAAARAWADAQEEKRTVQVQLTEAKPKIDFVDNYVTAKSSSIKFRDVAKQIDANERRLREFLKDSGIMYKRGKIWLPHAEHMKAKRFEVKPGVKNGHAFTETFFTPKGVVYVSTRWARHLEEKGQ